MIPPMTNCCCCIPLKAGVVVITMIWLIYGIYCTVAFGIYLQEPYDSTILLSVKDSGVITTILTIGCGLTTIGSAFGLFVVTCADTYRMLSIYTIIAYCIAGIHSITNIINIILTIIFKRQIMNKCPNPDNDGCKQMYHIVLTFTIVLTVIIIIVSVYFAMVISAYAHKRKDKEEIARSPYEGETNHEVRMT